MKTQELISNLKDHIDTLNEYDHPIGVRGVIEEACRKLELRTNALKYIKQYMEGSHRDYYSTGIWSRSAKALKEELNEESVTEDRT